MEKKQSKKLTKKLKERRLSAEISGYVHVDVLVWKPRPLICPYLQVKTQWSRKTPPVGLS